MTCFALFCSSAALRADGCFVLPPFVWDKVKDINEPSQKAILLYDKGREDMILQVKYEGPVNEFGWIIPVPSQPEVAIASMASFYELSRFTQKFVHDRQHRMIYAGTGGGGSSVSEPPVKVVEYRTVGDYDLAILASENADSLAEWLRENHFALREGSENALSSYLKKHWLIVALRVHLDQSGGQLRRSVSPGVSAKGTPVSLSTALRTGELHPLRISFDTPQCIFPLKVSSVNGKASEVLLYVLSTEPLVCPSLLKPVQALGFGRLPGELDWNLPAGAVSGSELKSCRADLPRIADRKWAFVKFQTVFQPEEMQDLSFESLFPLLRRDLEDPSNAYSAHFRLAAFEELALPMLPDLARSHIAGNRADCASWLHAYHPPEYLDLLLGLLDDPEPDIRFEACWAAEFYNNSRVITKLLALIRETEVNETKDYLSRGAALSCGKLGVRDPRVIEALIRLLDYEYPLPREEAQAGLVKITGQNFHSSQQWLDWWAKNKSKFRKFHK